MKKQPQQAAAGNNVKASTDSLAPGGGLKATTNVLDPKVPASNTLDPKSGAQTRAASKSDTRTAAGGKKSGRLPVKEREAKWDTLCTGLQLFIDEETVKRAWTADKPRLVIGQFVNDFFRQVGIIKNFEAMELSIVIDFHIFNLIYAKSELYFDDRKTSVFLNLMWLLLIHNSDDYKQIAQYVSDIMAKDPKSGAQFAQERAAAAAQQPQQPVPTPQNQQLSSSKGFAKRSLAALKSPNSDLECFKFWAKKHAVNNPPHSLAIFTLQELGKVTAYAQKTYFSNHSLYKHCLSDKNSYEEVIFNVYVDEPMYIPPLSEALYMGKPQLEIDDEDDEDVQLQQQLLLQQQQREKDQQNAQNGDGATPDGGQGDDGLDAQGDGDQNGGAIDGNGKFVGKKISIKYRELAGMVDTRLKNVKDEFNQTLHDRGERLLENAEEILNPGNKDAKNKKK